MLQRFRVVSKSTGPPSPLHLINMNTVRMICDRSRVHTRERAAAVFTWNLTHDETSASVKTASDSPSVGEQAVHDPGPLVLRCQHHGLLHVVVLLLSVACAAHHPGLHEGGPRVRQQAFNASFIHLNTTHKSSLCGLGTGALHHETSCGLVAIATLNLSHQDVSDKIVILP